MPATKEEIQDLEIALAALTSAVETAQLNLSNTITAIEEANVEIETRKAGFMSSIFSEVFEINLKLKYTNEEQRKVRLIELQNADLVFQNFVSVRTTLAETSATQKADIEKNRNLHKAKLQVLVYYANLP